MKERPMLMSVTTGQPSKRGKRLQSVDGLTWKQRNREAVNARRRELYAANPEAHRARQRAYKQSAKDKVNSYQAVWGGEYRAKLRAEMIAAYGGLCACCGEAQPEFLQLDHIHNDGAEDRKKNPATKLFAKLKRIGWPKDRYQLLCANCNFGKYMNGGICPHQGAAHA